MKIVAVSRVLNEEDIVEPLIRHHAMLVDHHILLDNGSVDRTVPILQALRTEGARLTVLQNDAVFFSETQYNTFLYELAVADYGADWVVFLDGDEFIDLRGDTDLAGFLASRPPADACVGLDTINYEAPTPATMREVNVVRRLVRRTAATIDVWKVCVRGGFAPGRVAVDAGQHHISLDGVQMPPPRQQAVRLAHYPNRAPLHWGAKAVTGRLKVLAAGQAELARQRNAHYVGAVAALKADPQAWARDATRRFERLMTAPELVDDPLLYLGEPLTHTRAVEYGWRALGLMLANMEKLATAHGALLDAHPLARMQAEEALASVQVIAGPPELAAQLARRAPARSQPALAMRLRRYRCVGLAELAAEPGSRGRAAVEARDWLEPATLDVPPLAHGAAELLRPGVVMLPPGDPGGARVALAATPSYLLRGVTLHGNTGLASIGERVIAETMARPLHGAAPVADMALPDTPPHATLHSAAHLMQPELRNYYHWLLDGMARFRPELYAAFAADPDSTAAPQLLLPTLDVFWKWESLGLMVPRAVPRLPLGPEANLFVERLLYLPDLSGATFAPHPALLAAFDTMRRGVMGDAELPRPWRRLYISRADTPQRKLVNEEELAARAAAAGYAEIRLSRLPVADQIRLFAEASHIVAPHGAGLVNIGFCQPGAVLCELHMDGYVHWAYRRLAALRGVRYGCLIGETVGERTTDVNATAWRLDAARLDAALAASEFLGG